GDILGISYRTSEGSIQARVDDNTQFVQPGQKRTYGQSPVSAAHATRDTTWDGPYEQPTAATDWSRSFATLPTQAKPAADALVGAVIATQQAGVPVDTTFTGVGEGDVLVTVYTKDAAANFPGQLTWDNNGLASGARSVNWTFHQDLFTPQTLRDVAAAGRQLQAALRAVS
ncbi:MAG: hypothetical protein H7123_07790, partial [Thermoleophilia bacterium]|nr:hypothetical protein [Thermoleophilia bacterium]